MDSNEFVMDPESEPKFNFEEYLNKYKIVLLICLAGLILIGVGIFYLKNENSFSSTQVEVIGDSSQESKVTTEIVVEIAGEVEKPGVYKLAGESRVNDLLVSSGGLTDDADKVWFEKTINRAAKLIDGQKIYIPTQGEQSKVLSAKSSGGDQTVSGGNVAENTSLVNINIASLAELDKLPGIGPVYGQSIIEHRPYSSIEELLSKSVLKKNVYEKIKNLVSVY